MFLERGYADTRVQDITNAAGFTTGALYAHFGSRMEILAEALLTEGRRLIADMTDQAAHADIEDSNVSRRAAERLTGETRDIDRLMLEAITMATRDEDARSDRSRSGSDRRTALRSGGVGPGPRRGL